MPDDLRSKTIKLAASLPKGSLGRRALLDVLADESQTDWATLLRTQKVIQDEQLDVPDEYSQQVNLLKTLREGDRVTITYHDSQRGGEVKTVRMVSRDWQSLRDEFPSSFKRVQVLLEARAGGKLKSGMIADYGRQSGVVWQGTMRMPVRGVLALKKG